MEIGKKCYEFELIDIMNFKTDFVNGSLLKKINLWSAFPDHYDL